MIPATTLVEILLLLLMAASVVALLTTRLRIPYTAALVFAGVGIDLFRGPLTSALSGLGVTAQNFDILTPEVVFTLFLPGLLFEASLHLHIRRLRENLWPIVILAVAGVVVATVATGYALAWQVGLPLASALLFGSLISATDPISVVALFRHLGIQPRLTLIVEGESLFNDGTAIVLFQVLLAAAAGSHVGLLDGLQRFAIVVLGGLGLGMVLGFAASKLTSYVDEPRIEITLTTIVAYGAYLAAEHLHVSGVIATVAAGLVVANLGVVKGMSPRTRVALFGFWEYFAFVINSLVFLLIGMAVHVSDLVRSAWPIAIATLAVMGGRLLTVYGLVPVINRVAKPIPLAWQHVLFWGGLHGSVSIALALGLPADIPGRDLILSMAFGVVAFSIVVQGVTMPMLVSWLKLQPPRQEAYARLKAEQLAVAAARKELNDLLAESLISRPVHDDLRAGLDLRATQVEADIAESQRANPAVAVTEQRIARRRLALAERSALDQAISDGLVPESVVVESLDRLNKLIEPGQFDDE